MTDQTQPLTACERAERLHNIVTMLGLTTDPAKRETLCQMLSDLRQAAAAADTGGEAG